ncbi:uncharacterized protein LOC143296631 [Babylonia areolata]|uniref:uncharacterized protein LOC143296631 n=1 Tax=Babylonia areolata TaxID=304850 RepID=UPI003FD6648A
MVVSILLPPVSLLEQGFVYCPAYPCKCEVDTSGAALTIDCQHLYLTHLPKFLAFGGRVRSLSLKQNSIRKLPANAFRDLLVESLDLTENVISHVDPQAFQGLEDSLEELHLELYAMEGLPSEALQRVRRLKVLRIVGCKANTLRASVFEGLDSLVELYLQNCRIQTIEAGALSSSMKRLEVLHLGGNALTTQALWDIAHLKGLQRLVLARNRLTHLPRRTFAHLRHLRYLDLSKNKMTHVDVDAFKPLHYSLSVLHLHHNHLTTDIFLPLQHARNLQELMLSGNNITSIPKESLQNQAILTHLDVSGNGITELDKETLKGTEHHLEVLQLGDNPLSVFHEDTFQQHSKLQHLTLDNTRLGGTLRKHTFRGLNSSLKTLTISGAGLMARDLLALSTLAALEYLDASRNDITDIPHGIFLTLHSLMKLNLSLNHVQSLPDSAFRGLETSLEVMDLTGNVLPTVSSCVFDGFRRLRVLSLQNNPLMCDCRIAWFHTWMQVRLVDDDDGGGMLDWRCSGPEVLAGRQFGALFTADLQCPDNTSMVFPVCNFNTSGDVYGIEMLSVVNDPPPSSRVPPAGSTLNLEVQQTDPGSLLALWKISPTSSTTNTTTITGLRLTLQRSNDSQQEADVTLEPEVTQYLFTALIEEMVYNVCVTVLGVQGVRLGKDCVETVTTGGNRSSVADDEVLHETSPHLPISLTTLIWSYVSGSIIAVILCVIIAVAIHRRRRRRRHRRQSKPAPDFNPGYNAWDTTHSSFSSGDASSACCLSSPSMSRSREEGMGIRYLGGNLAAMNDEGVAGKVRERMWMQNLADWQGFTGKGVLGVGEFDERVARVGYLANSEDMSERARVASLERSGGIFGRREHRIEAFEGENPGGSGGTLERRVLRMGTFEELISMDRSQDDSEGILEMFDMSRLVGCEAVWERKSMNSLPGSESTLETRIRPTGKGSSQDVVDAKTVVEGSEDSLERLGVYTEGALGRRVSEAGTSENGIGMVSVTASLGTQHRGELSKEAFNREADVRNLVTNSRTYDTPDRRVLGGGAFEKGVDAQDPGSSGSTLDRRIKRMEAQGLRTRFSVGRDFDATDGSQSYRGTVMSPFHQHLPASYFVTRSDLGEDVIFQL